MADEIVVNLDKKKWWQKQRTWAMFLGMAGTICGVIPAAAVASVPLLTLAGLLGYKGMSDAQDRVENVVKAEAKAMLNAPPY